MSLPSREQSRAAQALRSSPIPQLRKLFVEETEATLIVGGTVSSYYLKQLAQETLMPFRGGRELRNRVTVVRDVQLVNVSSSHDLFSAAQTSAPSR